MMIFFLTNVFLMDNLETIAKKIVILIEQLKEYHFILKYICLVDWLVFNANFRNISAIPWH
jgi:hypothetical protein